MKTTETKKLKIAAIGDLHVHKKDNGHLVALLSKINKAADILLLAGDLTHTGDAKEANILLDALKVCSLPIVCVLGNHDYEKNQEKAIKECLRQHESLQILDGDSIVVEGIGIAGIKGFGGGFDNYMLTMFGEPEMKDFVQKAVNESLKLERALVRLDKEDTNMIKIVLMHYSPCSQTVKGENEQIFPFLGSSRLAEPLVRQNVIAVFHGHAHAGVLHGQISNVKVFNVAQPVLKKEGIEDEYFLFELDVPIVT